MFDLAKLQPCLQTVDLERLARDKHSSLFVNYGQKRFYNIGTCSIKLFKAIINNTAVLFFCAFVTDCHFQPSIIFVFKHQG